MSVSTIRLWFARRDATDESPAVTFRETALVLDGQIVTPQRKSQFTMDADAARQLYQMWERDPRAPQDGMFVDVKFDIAFVRGRFNITTSANSTFPHVSMFIGPQLPGKTSFDTPGDLMRPDTRSVYLSSRHRRSVLTCFVERGGSIKLSPVASTKQEAAKKGTPPQQQQPMARIATRRPRATLSWYQ